MIPVVKEGQIMSDTQTAIDVVILTDEADNHYAFSPEQLSEARVTREAVTDLAVVSTTISVHADLNKRPGAKW
jgi:hypothetical protein